MNDSGEPGGGIPSAEVEVQFAAECGRHPSAVLLRRWARAALGPRPGGTITIRIVDEAESAELNSRYRGRDHATNVLSFRAAEDWPAIVGEPTPIGDIVVCAPVLAREAASQGKAVDAHWAHIVIHGVLHLIGYDHEQVAEGAAMEAEERRLLAFLGYPDPYRDDDDAA